jgi:hypothetical protein
MSLRARVVAHDVDGIREQRRLLLVAGWHDVEREVQLLENRLPLG